MRNRGWSWGIGDSEHGFEHPDFPELKGVTHRPAYGLEINGKIVDSLYKYIDAKYKAELDALEEEVAKKSLAPKGPQSIVPSTEVPITPATILSILYLDEPASEKLRNTILKGYKENNDHKVARGEVPFDVTWGKVKMTDEEILNSPMPVFILSLLLRKVLKYTIKRQVVLKM